MSEPEVEKALFYGLNRARPDSAAGVLAREVQRLRAEAAVLHARDTERHREMIASVEHLGGDW